MRKFLESEIKKEILGWLRNQPNSFVFSISTVGIPNGQGGFRKNFNVGCADIIGVKNGKAFAFEVKRPKGKATEKQLDWLGNFSSAGGYACIVYNLIDAKQAYSEI